MIDVVFLLIIFFLCIDFKILEAKLPAYLPKGVGPSRHDAPPQEKLRIQILCSHRGRKKERPNPTGKSVASYYLVGHQVSYLIGAKKAETLEQLRQELERLARDPSKKQKDPRTGDLTIVIEPRSQVVYGDVAPLLDAVASIREPGTQIPCFPDIHFGGGLGGSSTDQR